MNNFHDKTGLPNFTDKDNMLIAYNKMWCSISPEKHFCLDFIPETLAKLVDEHYMHFHQYITTLERYY